MRALRARGARLLSGESAFKLYDTYGLPLDLTEDLLKADGIGVDRAGFERAMAEQRARAREAQKAVSAAGGEGAPQLHARRALSSRFVGDFVYGAESEVLAVLVAGAEVDEGTEGAEAALVVAETPFYGGIGWSGRRSRGNRKRATEAASRSPIRKRSPCVGRTVRPS